MYPDNGTSLFAARKMTFSLVTLAGAVAMAWSLPTVRATGVDIQVTPRKTQRADGVLLPAVKVQAGAPSEGFPQVYAGGQVATGARLGFLGQRDIMDLPFSVTSYTAKKVQDEQARSIADVLFANDPSVRTSIGASNRYDAFTIRGLRVANSDVAVNGLFGLLPNWRIGVDSVERIDLLKGPGAFMFGMAPGGAVGGTVDLATKRAGDVPLTELTTGYSSESMLGAHVDVGRRFGENKAFGVRLNLGASGGDTPYDRASAHTRDASLGLDYKSERLRLSSDVIYQRDRTRAQERGYSLARGVVLPHAPDPKINLSQDYDYSRSSSTTAMARAEYDLGESVMAYATFGFNTFHFDKREVSGGSILNHGGDILVSANAQQVGQYNTQTGEAGLRWIFATGPISHELTVSVNSLHQAYKLGQVAHADYISNIYGPVYTDTPVTSAYPEGRANELTLDSLAIADTLSWRDGLVALTLGGRQQNAESKSYAPRSGGITRRYDASVFTPAVGVVIRPLQQLSFYANYVQGLTPGPVPPGNATNSGDVFAPFKSKQYEVGTKLDLGHLGFGLSAFQIDVPNGITDPATHLFSVNGMQRNRGLELTTYGAVTDAIRLLGGITWFDAKQTRTAGGQTDDKFAIGIPHVQATLGAEWDIPSLSGLSVNTRVIRTGRTYIDSANTQSAPGWTRWDVGARYTWNTGTMPVTLRASVTNVFNRRYWEANPSGYVVAGAPAMAWISATFALP